MGAVLSRLPTLQVALAKSVSYTNFYQWKRSLGNVRQFSGGQRERRNLIFRYVAEKEGLLQAPITYYEFGVHRGHSLFWWSQNNRDPDSRFVGFDSFFGLPEDWAGVRPKGDFSTDGEAPKSDDPRVIFEQGWFHQTLPQAVERLRTENRRVIHMDADLYRSTVYPLLTIGPYLRPDDILMFDEFQDTVHEFRAFEDFCGIFEVKCDLLAASTDYAQTTFKITQINSASVSNDGLCSSVG